jgi:DNA modification methylase
MARTVGRKLRFSRDEPLLFRVESTRSLSAYEIVCADAFDWLASARRRSIHAVVTDPPYGLLE